MYIKYVWVSLQIDNIIKQVLYLLFSIYFVFFNEVELFLKIIQYDIDKSKLRDANI